MRLNRRGFTLIELIVATAIAGIAATVMIVTLTRQQKFFASADAIMETRGELRDAADVLAGDLRGAAVARFGVPVMTDSAVEVFAVIASSIACGKPAGVSIGLPPQKLVAGHTLTSILAQPDTGDLALVYAMPRASPDSAGWKTHRIASFTSRSLSTSCPPSTGFTTTGDEAGSANGYNVTLAEAPDTSVNKGAPIVFVRRVRYSLYRSSDGLWYLGCRRCAATGTGCAAIQPVSGPYRAYSSSPGSSGLSFRYFDESGAPVTASSPSPARIDIVIRGQSSRAASFGGDARTSFRDSVVVTVSPRNRL
jgi:prepilin-type N-terminal cleavage/methylation domain-containing protein